MRKLLIQAILAITPFSLLAQDEPIQQVMSVRAKIGPAMRAKDTAALERIWSPEMKVNSPGNTIMDRATVLKLLLGGNIKYSAFNDTVESTSVLKDVVIIMGHEQLTEAVGPDAGKPKIRRYTDVWQRNAEGSWMLIARQATYVANTANTANTADTANTQSPQGLVSCKPLSQKSGETGCWILGSQPVGVLTGPVYWTLGTFPTREQADRAKGPHGIVVESLGKVWLLTVGEKPSISSTGTPIAQIGPLPITAGQAYAAQYMEATLEPGMISKTHLHSGIEVFYTESGETCLETPDGKQVGTHGADIVVSQGVPMELTATGTETRRGMMLILHDASKPPTTLVDTWKSKGLCTSGK